jgi:hypothetical protein
MAFRFLLNLWPTLYRRSVKLFFDVKKKIQGEITRDPSHRTNWDLNPSGVSKKPMLKGETEKIKPS